MFNIVTKDVEIQGIVKAWCNNEPATVENLELKIGEPTVIKVEVTSKINGFIDLNIYELGVTNSFDVISGPSDFDEIISEYDVEPEWTKEYIWTISPNGRWTGRNVPINLNVQFNQEIDEYRHVKFTIANPYILDEQYSGPTHNTTDIIPPVLTIISPTSGASIANDTINVTGTTFDASGIASVTVNGVLTSGAADWSTWSAEVTLTEGVNAITAIATDNIGNQNNTTISVYLVSTSAEFLSIGSASAPTNSTITVPISVANVTDISGIYLDLLYNSSVATISSVSTNEGFVGSGINSNIDNANGITRIVLTNSNHISTPVETPVIDITFTVTGGSGSSTSLDLQNVEFSDAEFNPYTPAVVVDGQITVGIKGDLNGNGIVDIGDVRMVAFMVAGNVPEDLNADFNGNGRVDIGDAVKIAFYLEGKVSEL